MESFYDKEGGVAWGPITPEEIYDDIMRHKCDNVDRRRTLNYFSSHNDKYERFMELTHADTDAQKSTTNCFPGKNTFEEPITISSDEEELQEQYLLERLKIGSPTPTKLFTETNSSFEKDINTDSSTVNIQTCESTKQITECALVHENYDLNEDEKNEDFRINSPTLLQNYGKNDLSYSHGNMIEDEPERSDLENRLPTPANLDNDTYDDIYEDISDNEDEKYNSDIVENGEASSANHSAEGNLSHENYTFSEEDESKPDYPQSTVSGILSIQGDKDEKCDDSHEGIKENFAVQNMLPTSITIAQEDNNIISNHSDVGIIQNTSLGTKKKSCIPLNISQEYPLNDDHGVFNDTLEEMDRLLNQGLNYSMQKASVKSDNENLPAQKNIFKSPTVSRDNPKVLLSDTKSNAMSTASPLCNKGAINKKPLKLKIPTIQIPGRSNNKSLPKSTLTPTNTNKMLTPNPTPTSLKRRFKNIESPISVYIKNSGSTPLYKKVTPGKSLSCNKINAPISDKGNKENSIVFPEVIYKPAKNAIVTKNAEMKLPKKIVSLIPQKASIIKHQGRIGGGAKKDSSISRKLLEGDLTINSNISLNTTEDTSIHFNKRTYIT